MVFGIFFIGSSISPTPLLFVVVTIYTLLKRGKKTFLWDDASLFGVHLCFDELKELLVREGFL
jgi:hypothetical protein